MHQPHDAGPAGPVAGPETPPPPQPLPPGSEAPTPPYGIERRRRGWAEFRQAYPGIVATMGFAFLVMLGVDGWLLYKRFYYTSEVDRLRSGMTDAERRQADAVIAAEENKLRMTIELVRRQAQGDKELNLSVEVDSGRMLLQREGALLREMPVEVAPAKVIGEGADTVRMAPPRGARTVERILEGGTWEVPKWVYVDLGVPVPADRSVSGALGPVALLLNGGTVLYAQPTTGPLADPNYILPGSIRARLADLRAVVPNLKPGSTVYFY